FKGEAAKLGALLAGRPALLTPHAMELSRLYGAHPQEVLVRRFDIAGDLARVAHAAVLLKGVPTVVADASGARRVSAAGTPALAAAGSGDLLAGRAAELASSGRGPRGVTLDDIEVAIGAVWPDLEAGHPPRYPVLAELPAI